MKKHFKPKILPFSAMMSLLVYYLSLTIDLNAQLKPWGMFKKIYHSKKLCQICLSKYMRQGLNNGTERVKNNYNHKTEKIIRLN